MAGVGLPLIYLLHDILRFPSHLIAMFSLSSLFTLLLKRLYERWSFPFYQLRWILYGQGSFISFKIYFPCMKKLPKSSQELTVTKIHQSKGKAYVAHCSQRSSQNKITLDSNNITNIGGGIRRKLPCNYHSSEYLTP